MTKEELIAKVADDLNNYTKGDVATILDSVIFHIMKTVGSGEAIYMRGFGCFSRFNRKPKTVRNFKTNSLTVKPARNVPKFKPYETFLSFVK